MRPTPNWALVEQTRLALEWRRSRSGRARVEPTITFGPSRGAAPMGHQVSRPDERRQPPAAGYTGEHSPKREATHARQHSAVGSTLESPAMRSILAAITLLVVVAGCAPAAAPSVTPYNTCRRDVLGAIVDTCDRWKSTGYELYIIKSANWVDAGNNPIDQQTWETFAASQPEPVTCGSVGDTIVRCLHSQDGPSMWWQSGKVRVKGMRTRQEISEIVRIAEKFGARVQGDDEEFHEF